jgi:hypothetical protein
MLMTSLTAAEAAASSTASWSSGVATDGTKYSTD